MDPDRGYFERSLSARDGLRLHFRDYGDPLAAGVPLLCLSGLTRNAKDFHPLARRQAPQRRVVCPDYRGRGRSGYARDWRSYRPEVYVDDLRQLLAAANLHRVVICGTSLGGLLAMGLAVAAPSLLAGVILNDVGPALSESGLARIRAYVDDDRALPDWPAAIAHLKTLFPAPGYDSEAKWRRLAEATYRRGDDGRLHVDWDVRLARALGGPVPDLWPLFRALRPLPVLALRGARSDVLSPETFAAMLAVKPDLIQVSVPGVGHAPALDEPLVEAAIDDFLARFDP